MGEPPFIQATALAVGLRGRVFGLLLTGPSGAGKSSLAALLIDRALAQGRFAALVGDDGVLLAPHAGRLVARAPAVTATRGRLEMRGLGLVSVPHLPAAQLHGQVALADAVERLPEPTTWERHGVSLPSLALSALAAPLPALAVERWLIGNMAAPFTGG